MLNDKNEAVSSDQSPLVMEVKLESIPTIKEKREIPNYEDKESQL